MRKRSQNGSEDFKDIEILSEKIIREVAAMDSDAVDAIYDEIHFAGDPGTRVQSLAADAARHYADKGETVPEHVKAALDSAFGTDPPGIAAGPRTGMTARYAALVPIRELYDYGKQRALVSGFAKITADEESRLEAYAGALARQQRAEVYDPEQNYHDRLREEEYRNDFHRFEKLQMMQAERADSVRRYEEELVEVNARTVGGVPHVPAAITWLTVALLTLTMAPALHEMVFFRLALGPVAWLFSAIGGFFVGTIIGWAAAGQAQACPTSRFERWSLLSIATAMCLAASFMGAQHDRAGYVFAGGVSVVQIGSVLLLEWSAWRSREFAGEWMHLRRAHASVSARLHLARRELAERDMQLLEFRKRIDLHIQYVESRWVRHNRIEEIEDMAVRAVRDGYAAGIAVNRMRLAGTSGKRGKLGTREHNLARK